MNKPTLVTGIKKLYVAPLTKDDSTGLTYSAPIYHKGVQSLGIKPKYNQEPLYGEGQIEDIGTVFQQADIDFARSSLTSAERAYILGQTTIATGGVSAGSGDEPPFVAILYKANILGGYRYGVIYKSIFKAPDEDLKQQEGKTAYSIPTISGMAIPTDWSYTDSNSKVKNPWEYHVDTTDTNCPVDIDSTWFTNVTLPTVGAISAVSVASVPANNATAVVATAKPALTFNNAIAYEAVTLVKLSDSSVVACTKEFDATGKILTITPTSSLTSAGVYNIVIAGVKDIYNQALATSVIKFTVA